MGRRGPTAKPAGLRLLEGNPGKRPIREGPKPRPLRPTCPSWLSPQAKAEWRRLAPELERLGLLTHLDRAAFAAYCQSFAQWRECQAVLEEQGSMYITANGRLKERPEVEMAKTLAQLTRAFAVEFGLTPSSRARLSLPGRQDDEDDEFARLLD